ncbi:MAG: DUF4430 domain-containing protein [Solirubrobacteraceae bacterium]
MMRRWARTAVAALAVVAACAGCGLGPGRGTSDVTLTVTRDFGGSRIAALTRSKVPGSETVMRLLERSLHVGSSYGGGFVDSVDGHASPGARDDWFYYVNGVQGSRGAAGTAVHAGDHIWWDLHDWSATDSIPAVVGSFPEPFVHGIGGKRYPVTVECAPGVNASCARVTAALNRAHVPAAPQLLGAGSGTETISVLVGTWSQLHGEIVAALIDQGPGSSGVYARFAGTGTGAGSWSLHLLDPAGRVVKTLGADAGLIAATAGSSGVPTWVVAGTDAAGVADASRAFTAGALHDHFALAVSGAARLPIPLQAAR